MQQACPPQYAGADLMIGALTDGVAHRPVVEGLNRVGQHVGVVGIRHSGGGTRERLEY